MSRRSTRIRGELTYRRALARARRRRRRRVGGLRRLGRGAAGDAAGARHRATDARRLPDVHQRHDGPPEGRRADAQRGDARNVAQIARDHAASARASAYLIVAPLYHAAAAVTAFCAVARGGALFIQEDFVPGEVVRALSEERIVARTLVPAMIQALPRRACPTSRSAPTTTCASIIYGASPIADETLRRAMEVFGCDFAQGYGMTETTAVLTVPARRPTTERALRDKPELLLSAGRPCPARRCASSTRTTAPVPHGEIGEILAPRPAAHARLLEPAGGDGRGAARRLDAHRRRRAASTTRATCTSRTA